MKVELNMPTKYTLKMSPTAAWLSAYGGAISR